uniref:Uncharacterized protein n=1 Tax=Cyprinus carpio TaxID=7962 RepID=A0A8C1RW09_CYPCA
MKKQNTLRQPQSRRTVSPRRFEKPSCKAPEKLCSSAPRTKPALNTEHAPPNDDLIQFIEQCWSNSGPIAEKYSVATQIVMGGGGGGGYQRVTRKANKAAPENRFIEERSMNYHIGFVGGFLLGLASHGWDIY